MSSLVPYRDPSLPLRPRPKRLELLATGGLSALVAMLCVAPPGWAATGSYQAQVDTGNSNVSVAVSPDHTQIDIHEANTFITWTPNDADGNSASPIEFQPAGTSATFSSLSEPLTDFNVLNIVNAPGSRIIAMRGLTEAKVNDGQGNPITGGTVWFYSPNGFLVGSTARFDVGSLLLTANQPDGTDLFAAPNLTASEGSTAGIQIDAGAQLTASSYIALVAPRITQNGTVRANGEIAYVAGESVQLTMPLAGGLFGISVGTGTDGTAITHGGSTGGPATSNTAATRNIYMVAVPKNDAVTMLVGGSVGYDVAQSATTLRDGTILLAGGGAAVAGGLITEAPLTTDLPGTITIDSARFGNNLTAFGSAIAVQTSTADGAFAGLTRLTGLSSARMTIDAGRTISTGLNAGLTLASYGSDGNSPTLAGGDVAVTIGSGGTLALGGDLLIDARGTGYTVVNQPTEALAGMDGAGGTARVTLNDGAITGLPDNGAPTSAGPITITADARGGDGYEGGGRAQGGTASLTMNGGTLRANSLDVTAVAFGGGSESGAAPAGEAIGGSAYIDFLNGVTNPATVTVAGGVSARATGFGGDGLCDFCYDDQGVLGSSYGAAGGTGRGGLARIQTVGASIASTYIETVAIGMGGNGGIGAGALPTARGAYSDGGAAGAATGGAASILVDGGQVTATSVGVDASADGGRGGDALVGENGTSGDTGDGGAGGDATSGQAQFQVRNATLDHGVADGSSITISSRARGGSGGSSALELGGNGGNAGRGTPGLAALTVEGSSALQYDLAVVDAPSIGGDGGDFGGNFSGNNGGSATGGVVSISQSAGATAFLRSYFDAGAQRGIGGEGPGATRGTGGAANGGSVSVSVTGGTLALGSLFASSLANGPETEGTALNGGTGSGGTVTVTAAGTGALVVGDAAFSSYGVGGGGSVSAADGMGGSVTLGAQDSASLTFLGSTLSVDASAAGGNNQNGVGNGGGGFGGSVILRADPGGILSLSTSTTIDARAAGGGSGEAGGLGSGGALTIVAQGGTIAGGPLAVNVSGRGSDGSAGSGGGFGGNVTLSADSGNLQFSDSVFIDASGISNSGQAIGGNIHLLANDGPGVRIADAFLHADAGTVNGIARTGAIELGASAAPLTLSSLTATAAGDSSGEGVPISVTARDAQITVVNSAALQSGGAIGFFASGAGSIAVGTSLSVSASGDVTFGHVDRPAGVATLNAQNIAVNALSIIGSSTALVSAANDLSLSASDAISIAALAGGNVTAQGASISIGSPGALRFANLSSTAGDIDVSTTGELNVTAATSAGALSLTSSTSLTAGSLSAASTLAVEGDASVQVGGNLAAGGAITVQGGSVALTLGNDTTIASATAVTGDLTVRGAGALTLTAGSASGGVDLSGSAITLGTVTATGLFTAFSTGNLAFDQIGGGQVQLTARDGAISGTKLTSTAAATIRANGSVTISSDFASLGGSVDGSSVALNSVGPLMLGHVGAASGAVVLISAGNLDVGNASAAGAIELRSTQGTVNARDLSTGESGVTATGSAVTLGASGALLVAQAAASAGDLVVSSRGPLTVNDGRASRAIRLTSVDGGLSLGSLAPGTDLLLHSAADLTIGDFEINGAVDLASSAGAVQVGTVSATGNISVVAATNLGFTSLSGSTLALTATAGTLNGTRIAANNGAALIAGGALAITTDVAVAGTLTASGADVSLVATGPLSVASATATNGGLTLQSFGDLTLAQASVTGAASLSSDNGNVSIGALAATGDVFASGYVNLGFGSVSGRDVRLYSQNGNLTGSSLTATGTAELYATLATSVTTNIAAAGGVTAQGASVALTATGPLLVTNALARDGGITLATAGDLTLTEANASGALAATSSGGIVIGTANVDAATITAAGDIAVGALTGSSLDLNATNGALTAATISSSGATRLRARGAIAVSERLQADGGADIIGASIRITNGDALRLTNAVTTGGDLIVNNQGPLTIDAADVRGDVALTGSEIVIGTASATGLFDALAGGSLRFTRINGASARLASASGTITGANLRTTGAATVQAPGQVTVDTDFAAGPGSVVDAGMVRLTTLGALSLARVRASDGAIAIQSGGDLTLAEASAVGAINLRSTGGALDARGLTSAQDAITAQGTAVTLGATGALRVADATASAGDLVITATGPLSVTSGSASGAIRLTSAEASLSIGTLAPGTDLLLHSATDLSLGDLAVSGAVDLASRDGAIFAGAISAGGDISAVAGTDLGFTSLSGRALTLTATRGALTGNRLTASNGAALTAGGVLRIVGDIAVTGALTASGSNIVLVSSNPFSIANATAIDTLLLQSAGDLTLSQATAGGAASVISTDGGLAIGTLLAGGDLSASGYADVRFGSLAGHDVVLNSQNSSVIGGSLTANGTAGLYALRTATITDNVAAAGGVTALAGSVALRATGPLVVTNALARSGTITLVSNGDLTLTDGTASGALSATSTGGRLRADSVASGGDLLLRAADDISLGDVAGAGAVDVATSAGGISADTISALGDVVAAGQTGLTFASLSGRALTLSGGSGALTGGVLDATNGAALTAGGAITVAQANVTGPFSAIGRSVSIRTPGGLVLTSVTSTGGDIVLAGSTITLDTLSSAGGVTFTSTGGIAIGNLTLNADLAVRQAGDVRLGNVTTGGAIDLASTAGSLTTGTLAAAGDVALAGATGLSFTAVSGRALSLSSGSGALTGSGITATDGATLSAGGAIVVSGANVSGAFSAIGRSLAITAPNGLAMTRASATGGSVTGGSVTLTAQAGSLAVDHLMATGAATLAASGAIVSGDINAAGGVTATGGSIDLTAPGTLTLARAVATAGDLFAQSVGDLTLVSGQATRSIALTSTAGSVIVHDATVAATLQAPTLRLAALRPAGLDAASATAAGDIAITAAVTATIDGSVNAGGAIALAAASANLTGSVIGRSITISTRGVAIGGNARIGQIGTTTAVTFNNNGTQRSFIGGTSGDGYLLTATGLSRVAADAITLNLPAAADGSAANPDVIVNDLTLRGPGNLQATLANLTSSGVFTINTPGRVRVSGALLLTDLVATNSARITAGPEIDIISPTGSILLTSSGAVPTGSLELSAQRIIIASQTALTEIAALATTDARSTRLATNDGPLRDLGYVAADHLTFRIGDRLNVQNSGGTALADRRGVTAVNGVDVIVTGTGVPEVILNGRQANGADFGNQVLVNGRTNGFILTEGSTINGCNIASLACGITQPTQISSLILPPQDVVGLLSSLTGGGDEEDDKKSSDDSHASPGTAVNRPLISIVRSNPYSYGTVIDEPVTGAPNDDLWTDQPIGTGAATGEGAPGGR